MPTRPITVAEMRALERAATQTYHIPALILMEIAGLGAAREILARVDRTELGRGVLVVAGRGNNGGDGYVVARHLHAAGLGVAIAMSGPPETNEADANYRIAVALQIPFIEIDDPRFWPEAGVVIDGLFGVGFKGVLREDARALIAAMNAHGRSGTIVALDVPSGLDADSGQASAPTVLADLTLTFGAMKTGLAVPEARAYTGVVVVVDLGLPPALLAELGTSPA